MKLFFFALLNLIFTTSCADQANQEDSLESSIPELHERLTEYYEFEKSGNWEKAYDFHTALFKSVVSRPEFTDAMRNDNQGWELKEANVVQYVRKGDRVLLRMEYIEKPSATFLSDIGAPSNIEKWVNEDAAVWIMENGDWYIHDAGSRARFTVTAPIER